MARVYRDQLDQPGRAAPLWSKAAELAPEHPSAGTWLLEAGKAYDDAGMSQEAIARLELATQHESSRSGRTSRSARSSSPRIPTRRSSTTRRRSRARRTRRCGASRASASRPRSSTRTSTRTALAQLALVEPDAVVKHRKERLTSLDRQRHGPVGTDRPQEVDREHGGSSRTGSRTRPSGSLLARDPRSLPSWRRRTSRRMCASPRDASHRARGARPISCAAGSRHRIASVLAAPA
jgi:hypothetical protein